MNVQIVSNWFNNKRKNARSKHLKQQFNTTGSNNSSLSGLTLNSHSLNSSTGSANLSQSSNPNYLNNNLQNSSPTSSNAYLSIQQQQQSHHQMQQNHQQETNFGEQTNYGYDCNSYNNAANTSNQQSNPNNQMHIVRNPSVMQFKNEPEYQPYLDNCFNKLPNNSSTNSKSDNENDDLGQDHDESNISEFSSQSFNGNDSIDN